MHTTCDPQLIVANRSTDVTLHSQNSHSISSAGCRDGGFVWLNSPLLPRQQEASASQSKHTRQWSVANLHSDFASAGQKKTQNFICLRDFLLYFYRLTDN